MTRLDARVPSVAAAQLSMLLATSERRPSFDGVEIRSEGTPIYDLEGDVLFERVALDRHSYVDLAVVPEFGGRRSTKPGSWPTRSRSWPCSS